MEDKYSLFEARFARLFIIVFLWLIVYNVEVKSRLFHVERYTWPKILNRMITDSERLPVVPFTFRVPDCTEKLENNETWISPSFVPVLTNEYTTWLSLAFLKGKGITVSFFFRRTNGWFMDWHWPQNVMFTLELLNQQYNSNHLSIPYLIDIKRCLYVDDATVRYTAGFVSANFLDEMSNQHLKNGNAYLRVSYDRSIYNYIDWYMRRYLNITLSNYSARFLWVIGIILIIECQSICEAQLKEFIYLNETASKVLQFLAMVIVMCILYNIGVFHV